MRVSFIFFLLAGCASTDFTSGLPCTRDEQCGGGEACENDYCGGRALASDTGEGTDSATSEQGSTDAGISTSAGSADSTGDTTGKLSTDSGATECLEPTPGCPSCDPVGQNCPADEICHIQYDHTASCWASYETEAQPGDECTSPVFNEYCAAGLYCAPYADRADCDATYCCNELCDLTAPACPTGACVPFFVEPAPELEHVGKCVSARSG